MRTFCLAVLRTVGAGLHTHDGRRKAKVGGAGIINASDRRRSADAAWSWMAECARSRDKKRARAASHLKSRSAAAIGTRVAAKNNQD